MSYSDRDPAGKPRTAPSQDLFGEDPYPWIVTMAAVPPKTRSEMGTVDPVHRVGAPRADETDPRFLVARARVVLERLELAGQEVVDETTRTRLFFSESRNDVTGVRGIIARERLSTGSNTRPLAELLSTDGELTDQAKNQANEFGWSVAKRHLEIVVYAEHNQKYPRPAAFAAIRNAEAPEGPQILARLLVTPFEISQWNDHPDEMRGDAVC